MARSARPDHGFTCFWRITDFDITSTSSDCLYKSEKFRIPMLSSSSWHLELEHTWRASLGLYLYKEDENNGNSNIDIQMSVLMSSGWRTRFSHFFKFKPGGTGHGTSVLVDWKKAFSRNNHVLDGCLTVSCHISNGATWDKYEQCFLVSNVTDDTLFHLPAILEFNDLEPKHLVNFPTPTVTLTEAFYTSLAEAVVQNLPQGRKKQHNDRSSGYSVKEVETKSTQTESMEDGHVLRDSDDLLKLFKDKRFQYVTLRTPSKDFAVHKTILCARSTVFNAMLEKNAVVDIDDVHSDTLSVLLQYLYQESIQINDLEWDVVLKLYYAAAKYQITQLKRDCCSYLKKNSTDENVCDPSIFEEESEIQETVQENIASEERELTSNGSWCF
ncbi:uncharacterized protein [Parasteatoda tepidariorum]|uniref:uncharacterized protein n=1 Tax=Parasteatoda tepidariorum TaxID=114398 RepID=UPI001C7202A6|nr:uncharacterized protein LOC107450757 [Parasteatoda tepidariorum]